MELDISKSQSIDESVSKFKDLDKIDVLLNNAGILDKENPFDLKVV